MYELIWKRCRFRTNTNEPIPHWFRRWSSRPPLSVRGMLHRSVACLRTRFRCEPSSRSGRRPRLLPIRKIKIGIHWCCILICKGLFTANESGIENENCLRCLSFITARKRSCGKVMFLHVSVILFTAGGGVVCHKHPPLGRQPPCTVHGGIRSTSGRYASCWNAIFLWYFC